MPQITLICVKDNIIYLMLSSEFSAYQIGTDIFYSESNNVSIHCSKTRLFNHSATGTFSIKFYVKDFVRNTVIHVLTSISNLMKSLFISDLFDR